MKKYLIFTLYILFLSCNVSKKGELLSPFDILSKDVFAIFQINNIDKVEQEIKNNFLLSVYIDLFKEKISDFDFLKVKNPELISLSKVGKNEIAITLFRDVSNMTKSDSLSLAKMRSITYSNSKIYITRNLKKKSTYRTIISNYEIISTSQLVLENCIRNYNSRVSNFNSSHFKKLYKSIDVKAPLNIFLHKNSDFFFEKLIPYTPLIPNLTNDWITFDYRGRKKYFDLNGISFINDSIPHPHTFIKNHIPKKLSLDLIVPNNFTAYLNYRVEPDKLDSYLKKWLLHKNIVHKNNSNKDLLTHIDEVGWIEVDKKRTLVVHLNDFKEAKKLLVNSSKEAGVFKNITLFESKLPEILKHLSNAYNISISTNYTALIDDYIIFSNELNDLKSFITNYKEKVTLSENPIYNSISTKITKESSFIWVGNNKKIIPSKNDKKAWQDNYPFTILQGVNDNEFTHLHFSSYPNFSKYIDLLSNRIILLLDAPFRKKPQWLKNHKTNTKDIAIQDKNNVLYLFSSKGVLFWKKKLSSPIQGDIIQVDLYKNNKLQMAFRTEKEFLILDRNGKEVTPFNIKLPSAKHILPLAVFDYDSSRDYRFVIAQDKKVYMYNNKGKIVRGFELKNLSRHLVNSPKHIRIQQKDYLLFPFIDGTISILNRKGEPRINIKEKITFSSNEIYKYLNTFTTTDVEGNLVQIDTNGKTTKTELKLEKEHSIVCLNKSLVSLSKNILNIDGIQVKLNNSGSYLAPQIFYINNTTYISVTDTKNSQIHVFYKTGKEIKGSPFKGMSHIDFSQSDDDSPLELVTQNSNNELVIYEIE